MLPSDPEQIGRVLLPLARAAIGRELGNATPADRTASWLAEPGATFVTLRLAGELRGCIGSVEARRSLVADVENNAIGAAFRDPRFSRLTAAEFARIVVEVSLLSVPERLPAAASEAAFLAQFTPMVDGVILEFAGERATFLPQVWESLPEPRAFIAELKEKAGLPRDFWSPELRASRYAVQKWSEQGVARSAEPVSTNADGARTNP